MGELQRGWRVLLGAMVGSGFGIALFYFASSLFTVSITKELGLTRGEFAGVQALLIVGALFAPFIGRLLDRFGFRWVFGISLSAVMLAHLALATVVSTYTALAIAILVYGIAGIGCGPLAYTRPINAWFKQKRGLALGLAAVGPALTVGAASYLLAWVIETHGWRAGYGVLAGLALFICLPVTLWLVRNEPPEGVADQIFAPKAVSPPQNFYSERDFWLLAGAMICMSIPGAGLLSQVAPLMQDEGFDALTAASGVSAFGIGQVIGRIVAGWCLDRINPRIVALLFTAVPAIGFVMLWSADLPLSLAIAAVALAGIQQGADIDLFAYFTARRFGMLRYGAIYGSVIAAGWVGNAVGIISFGRLFDAYNSYAVAELIGAGLLIVGAILIASVRIDPPVTS
jgi:MFS family permease